MSRYTDPERVLLGAAALDRLYPGWAERVDKNFQLSQSHNCIGHHIVGSDPYGVAWMKVAREINGHTPDLDGGNLLSDDDLHDLWVAEIDRRKEAS